MLKIVVTGGIGSGKTAVTDYLAAKGFPVLDADQMSRAITAPGGKAIPYIREHFGDEYILPDGSMDRKAMRELVYNNSEALTILEEGTTNVVVQDLKDGIAKEEQQGSLAVFLAIPLFFETGSDVRDYDAVWSVIADESIRIHRVMSRDRLTEAMVHKIMSKQVSDVVRLKSSTDVIDNSGTLEDLYPKVDALLKKYDLLS